MGRNTNGWAINDCLSESQRKGQTPNWRTANFSAESLTLRYRISKRSNSKDSRHGALVTPVISMSMATKSAARTCERSSTRAESKLDRLTCFKANVGEVVERARDRTRESKKARLGQCFVAFMGAWRWQPRRSGWWRGFWRRFMKSMVFGPVGPWGLSLLTFNF